MRRALLTGLLAASLLTATLVTPPAMAETVTLAATDLTIWKAVYGRIEAREVVPARARIGGVVETLKVTEGDEVTAGQEIAVVHDDKIAFRIAALDAQISGLQAQLATAESDLERGQALVGRGVVTAQRLDQLGTGVDVLKGQIASAGAERQLAAQAAAEGHVLAPGDGRVLTVPVSAGAVILPGEPVATIGMGGVFLRLAVPERHAADLHAGQDIRIISGGAGAAGRVARLYPQIENGRVIADVEVAGLRTDFVDARVLVELPVGTRPALLVPAAALATRAGLDFVTVMEGGAPVERAVVAGARTGAGSAERIEVLSGLAAGDQVVLP